MVRSSRSSVGGQTVSRRAIVCRSLGDEGRNDYSAAAMPDKPFHLPQRAKPSQALRLVLLSLGSFLSAGVVGTALARPSNQTAPEGTKAVAPAPAQAASGLVVPARYPLDPICPWGRIGDGQGILVRCLEQQEAIGLLANSGNAVTNVPLAEAPKPTQRVVFRSVGKARPDSGSLPEARPQLSKPKQRYVQCVEMHGGVEGSKASVVVRFLVRERGRAEGVSVKSRRGMSKKAARCIAEVVDRRYVGFPEAPIVGVTLEIRLAAEKIAP